MIADSPYQAEELVLTPRVGAITGALASIVMIALVGLVQPVGSALAEVGRTIFPDGWMQPAWRGTLLGLGVQVAVGSALGLLYASSQRQAPPAATLITGVVFGVMIWVGARVLSLLAVGGMRELIHSGLWFVSCLAYGAILAVAAVLSQRFRPSVSPVVLRD